MAEFKVNNENLFDFAVLNYRIQQQDGLINFDRSDFLKIVESGTTSHLFADGNSIQDAFNNLKNKVTVSKAENILFVIEISISMIAGNSESLENSFKEFEKIITSKNIYWNIYPVEEPVCRMHLLINN